MFKPCPAGSLAGLRGILFRPSRGSPPSPGHSRSLSWGQVPPKARPVEQRPTGGLLPPMAPSGPRWRDLPWIYPPTEVLCLLPPGFPFLRGLGKDDAHGPILGRKLLPTRGSGSAPPFPSTRTAKLRSDSPQGCQGCLGGSGVPCPCPYTEPPPVPSRPASSAPRTELYSGCQTRCGCKLMKT